MNLLDDAVQRSTHEGPYLDLRQFAVALRCNANTLVTYAGQGRVPGVQYFALGGGQARWHIRREVAARIVRDRERGKPLPWLKADATVEGLAARGFVPLSTLSSPLGVSSKVLARLASENRVPTARKVSVGGRGAPPWFVRTRTAERLTRMHRAGRPLPWDAMASGALKGRVLLCDLAVRIGRSREGILAAARAGLIPTAERVSIGSTGHAPWVVSKAIASDLVRQAADGHGALLAAAGPIFNATDAEGIFQRFLEHAHPDSCEECRVIWGSIRPTTLEDFRTRYLTLRSRQRRHVVGEYRHNAKVQEAAANISALSQTLRGSWIPLSSLEPALRIARLSTWAGRIEGAQLRPQLTRRGRESARLVWYVPKRVAQRLLDDVRAGRPMPWEAASPLFVLRARFHQLQFDPHPADCPECRRAWGAAGRPQSLEDFCARYEDLSRSMRNHVGRKSRFVKGSIAK